MSCTCSLLLLLHLLLSTGLACHMEGSPPDCCLDSIVHVRMVREDQKLLISIQQNSNMLGNSLAL